MKSKKCSFSEILSSMNGRFLFHSSDLQLWLCISFNPVLLFVVAIQGQVRLKPKVMDNFMVR